MAKVILRIAGVVLLGVSVILLVMVLRQNQSATRLEVASVSGSYPETMVIPVSVKQLQESIDAFDIQVLFDKDLFTIEEINPGTIRTESGQFASIVSTTEARANATGEIVFVYLDITGGDEEITSLHEGNVIAYLVVKPKRPDVKAEFVFGTCNLVTYDEKIYDEDMLTLIKGEINIK